MRLNIAVLEDDPAENARLSAFIRNWAGVNADNFGMLMRYSRGEDIIRDFMPEKYNIVLMDILMDDLNGIETAKKLRELDMNLLIVFMTTSREYIFDAFPLHTFDYILKPYRQKDVSALLTEAVSVISSQEREITLKLPRSERKVKIGCISSAVSNRHNIEIHMTDGECITAMMKFSEIEELLAEDTRFLVCSRGVMLNMERISAINNNTFIMKEGQLYPIRTRGRAKIRDTFSKYLVSRMRCES